METAINQVLGGLINSKSLDHETYSKAYFMLYHRLKHEIDWDKDEITAPFHNFFNWTEKVNVDDLNSENTKFILALSLSLVKSKIYSGLKGLLLVLRSLENKDSITNHLGLDKTCETLLAELLDHHKNQNDTVYEVLNSIQKRIYPIAVEITSSNKPRTTEINVSHFFVIENAKYQEIDHTGRRRWRDLKGGPFKFVCRDPFYLLVNSSNEPALEFDSRQFTHDPCNSDRNCLILSLKESLQIKDTHSYFNRSEKSDFIGQEQPNFKTKDFSLLELDGLGTDMYTSPQICESISKDKNTETIQLSETDTSSDHSDPTESSVNSPSETSNDKEENCAQSTEPEQPKVVANPIESIPDQTAVNKQDTPKPIPPQNNVQVPSSPVTKKSFTQPIASDTKIHENGPIRKSGRSVAVKNYKDYFTMRHLIPGQNFAGFSTRHRH